MIRIVELLLDDDVLRVWQVNGATSDAEAEQTAMSSFTAAIRTRVSEVPEYEIAVDGVLE